jgi:nucleoside-diphosphate-sugar epimerase
VVLQDFASIVKRIANTAFEQGLLPTANVDQVSGEEMDELIPHGSGILGTNALISAKKARQLLGWKPKYKDLDSEISRVVASEASRLGTGERK